MIETDKTRRSEFVIQSFDEDTTLWTDERSLGGVGEETARNEFRVWGEGSGFIFRLIFRTTVTEVSQEAVVGKNTEEDSVPEKFSERIRS